MKAQFKYAFRAGLSPRGIAFAIIAGMMLVFGILALTIAPFEALMITAVSLGGCGIAVMMVLNVVSDIAIVRRMFAAPEAYLHALTPVHRGKTLFASLVAMMIMDIISMAVVITGEVWLSLLLAGENVIEAITGFLSTTMTSYDIIRVLWVISLIVVAYLLIVTVIIFCMTASKSVFYQRRGGGIATFLLACACGYAVSLLPFLLAPFGTVSRYYIFFSITLSGTAAMFAYVLLNLLAAAGFFVLTARLMERKINI